MLLPIDQVISGYVSGEGFLTLAKQFNCYVTTIRKILVNNNIPIRKKWEHRTMRMPTTNLSDFQKQVIEGHLLGDGSVLRTRVTPYFSIVSIHQSFTKHNTEILPFKFRTRVLEACKKIIRGKEYNCKISYRITSSCDKSLNDFRDSWYKNSIKIIPKNLCLSPTSVKYWFYGDGSTSFTKYNSIQLTLCTNCFTVPECKMLSSKLYDICGTEFGVYLSEGKPMLKTVKKQGVNQFFEYIGECTVPCFQYKWKFPK